MDMDVEMQKVQAAIDMGAEAIMDLSSFGDTQKFRRKLTSECPAVLGTVPIYDAVVYYNKALKSITSDEWMDIVRMHAEDGVDCHDDPLWNQSCYSRPFQRKPASYKYRIPRRFHYFCLDGINRK